MNLSNGRKLLSHVSIFSGQFQSVPKGDFAMKYIFDGNVLQNSDIRGQLARKGEGDDGFVSDEMTFVPKSRYKSAFK